MNGSRRGSPANPSVNASARRCNAARTKDLLRRLRVESLGRTRRAAGRTGGVKVEFDIIEANDRDIGDVFTDYVRSEKLDLLVMGAFGHSRVRDFVLGGATKSMLRQPPVPLLLSH